MRAYDSDGPSTAAGLSGQAALPAKPSDLPNPDEAASLQLILSIGRSFKYVDDYVRPRMQRLGLTMTEFSVLTVLYHRGPTPLGDLSDRILLTGASTTYTVKKLEERGLMTRKPLEGDRRVILGSITETGRQLLASVFPSHTRDLLRAMRGLSRAEKETVTRLLRKMQTLDHSSDNA